MRFPGSCDSLWFGERLPKAALRAIFLTFLTFEKDSENQRNQTGVFFEAWAGRRDTLLPDPHPVFRGNTMIKESEWRFNVVLGSREAVATGVLRVLWWSSEISTPHGRCPHAEECPFPATN